jgi:hypothetical protein
LNITQPSYLFVALSKPIFDEPSSDHIQTFFIHELLQRHIYALTYRKNDIL